MARECPGSLVKMGKHLIHDGRADCLVCGISGSVGISDVFEHHMLPEHLTKTVDWILGK